MMRTIALCLCLLGLAAPIALAQTPSQTGYGDVGVVPPPPPDPDPPKPEVVGSSADDLPFTGLDVGIIVLGAVVLLGAGIGLRRVAASRSTP